MPSAGSGIRVEAPAKLNLFLRALGRRADGYTEIVTLFQTVSLADRLTIARTDGGIGVKCDHPLVPQGEENLAHRAARLYLRRAGLPGGAAVVLEKRIPVAAGLGGGSSDAAAVLRGLNRLSPRRLPDVELLGLAAELGSDVPFFLLGGTALGRGRGEVLEPLPDLPPVSVVLVYPGIGVSAAFAYRALEEGAPGRSASGAASLTGREPESSMIRHFVEAGDLSGLAPLLSNDLEAGVLRTYPEVGLAREALAKAGAEPALMTGSGSACFGLFRTEELAAAVRREIAASHPGWSVLQTRFRQRETA